MSTKILNCSAVKRANQDEDGSGSWAMALAKAPIITDNPLWGAGQPR
jgi:hypothetical protein